jgi:outer membrane receptor protein involved in Fe transport
MDNRFKLDLGFSMAVDIADETKFYIYPQAEIKYSLFNDIFIPFAGIKGGLTQNSFTSLAGVNQFLAPSVVLSNENNPYDIFGGVKGTLSKKMGFNVNVSFKKITNKALFITDTLSALRNRFDLRYDTLNHTRIEASLFYQLDEKLKIDGLARYNSYETKNEAYAWNLPVLEFQLRAAYNLFDKFMLNLDGHIETGRKALVYQMIDGVEEADGQYYISLGSIVDFNLGVSYRYNKRITAFLQLNNIASQRYNDWYNYPVQPIQVMGGVSFRF